MDDHFGGVHKMVPAANFDVLQRRLSKPGQYDPRVAKVMSTPAPWEQLPNTLRNNPPSWLDDEELSSLPDAFTDNRELWEMIATCTPMSCISAHYSSLTLRVAADWLERKKDQADANGWKYEPCRLIHDLRMAAVTADVAIEMDDALPRKLAPEDVG